MYNSNITFELQFRTCGPPLSHVSKAELLGKKFKAKSNEKRWINFISKFD